MAVILTLSDIERAHHEIVEGLSRGEVCRLEWEMERELGKRSTYYLSKYILGYDKMGNMENGGFHHAMCRFFDDNIDCNQLHLHPRKHYKTSCLSIGGNIRQILNDPDMAIPIICNVLSQSRSVVDELKNHFIINEKFRALYPEHATLTPSQEGTQDRFTTPARKKYNRYPTVMTGSADTGIVGKHFKYIYFDDIVDDKNTNTIELVDKIYNNFTTSLSTAGKNKFDQPWHYLVGTRWHYFDTYQRIIDRWKQNPDLYRVMMTQAEWEEEDPVTGRKTYHILFPEQFSKKYLEYIKDKECQGGTRYNCLYLNDPVPDAEATMDPRFLKYYNEEDKWFKDLRLNLAMFVDPARSKDAKRDPTVISIFGMDCDGNLYVRHVERFWGDPKDVVDRVITVANSRDIREVGFEAVASQLYGLQWIEEKRDARECNFRMHEVKRPPTKTKTGRHDVIIPYLKEGKIFVRENEPELGIIRQEFREHPVGRYDDFKDTLADALSENILRAPPKPRKDDGERFQKMPLPHPDRHKGRYSTGFRYYRPVSG